MGLRLGVSIILCIAFVSQSEAASFDCSKAATFAEQSICSNPRLSELDDQLAAVYRAALANSANPQSLKDVQSWWLTAKRDVCRDLHCLEAAYGQRIQELNAIVSFAARNGAATGQRQSSRTEHLPTVKNEPQPKPASRGSVGEATTYVDGQGVEYLATENEHGITLKSGGAVIYLGKSCDAFSPQHGEGKWGWQRNGLIVRLKTVKIEFPGQKAPFDDDRCPLNEQVAEASTTNAGTQAQPVVEDNLSMAGKLDNKEDIKAVFKITGTQIEGSYFIAGDNKTNDIKGTIDAKRNMIINEYEENGMIKAFFVGKFVSDKRVEGFWTKPSENQTMPFYLETVQQVPSKSYFNENTANASDNKQSTIEQSDNKKADLDIRSDHNKVEVGALINVGGRFEQIDDSGTIKIHAYNKSDKIQGENQYHFYYIYEISHINDPSVHAYLKSIGEGSSSSMIRIDAKIEVTDVIGAVIKGNFKEWINDDLVKKARQYNDELSLNMKKHEESRKIEYDQSKIVEVHGMIENYYERDNYFGFCLSDERNNSRLLSVYDVPPTYRQKIDFTRKAQLPINLKVALIDKNSDYQKLVSTNSKGDLIEHEVRAGNAVRFVEWVDVDYQKELENAIADAKPPSKELMKTLQAYKKSGGSINIPKRFKLSGKCAAYDVIQSGNNRYYVRNIPVNDIKLLGRSADDVTMYVSWYMGDYEFEAWDDSVLPKLEKMKVEFEQEEIEKKKRYDKYVASLKAGEIPIQTLQDAIIYTNASDNLSYTITPPINMATGADEYFAWQGTISDSSEETYICWEPDLKRGFAFTNIKKIFGRLYHNGRVTVVGRYAGNIEITLVIGMRKHIPVLADCYVFGPN